MIGHIYNSIYKFLLTKHAIDDQYISAFKVASNPKFDIWFNAEGSDKEKKSHSLKELKHYLKNIEIISNYLLWDHSQEDARQKLLDSLKQQINTASILAFFLEQNPEKYDELVYGAKEYAKLRKELRESVSIGNEKVTTKDEETEGYQYDDVYNTENDYVAEINITNQTNITIEHYE